MGVSEGEEREKGVESLFKDKMAENFPNLGRDLDIQVHEVNRSPNKLNVKIYSLRPIIIKLSKSKQRGNLENSKRKEGCNLQGNPLQGYQWISQQRPYMTRMNPQKCISGGSEKLWFSMSLCRKNSVRGKVIDKKCFIRIECLWGLQVGRQDGAALRA